MFKVLLTGFGKFGDFEVNPTEVLVQDAEAIDEMHLEKEVFDVNFELIEQVYPRLLKDMMPDLIINLGLNAQAHGIQLERFALNQGFDHHGERSFFAVDEALPQAYQTKLDLTDLHQKLNAEGIPTSISNHAGVYLCNYIYYQSLHYAAMQNKEALFVHLPFTTELVCDFAKAHKPTYPSLPKAYLQKAIRLILEKQYLIHHVQ